MSHQTPDWLEEAKKSGLKPSEAAFEEYMAAVRAQSDLFTDTLREIADLIGRMAED